MNSTSTEDSTFKSENKDLNKTELKIEDDKTKTRARFRDHSS